MGNPGEYRKGRIRASIGESKIRVSTGKVGSGRVPKMGYSGEYQKWWDPSEYRKGGNPGEYRKWGIRVSTENRESG